ncbi:MAG: hypothetical protein ACYC6N_23280 [Pirellulaceae bacterium]
MEPKVHPSDDLNGLERVLRELAPTPARLDVAQTMFRAGQAAALRPRARQRFWPATAAVLAGVSLTLGLLLAMPRPPQIVYFRLDDSANAQQVAQVAPVPIPNSNDADPNHLLPGSANPWSTSADHAEMQIAYVDSRWLTPLSPLRLHGLGPKNPWSATVVAPEMSQQATIPALCSGDWRAMLECSEQHPVERSGYDSAL